MDYNHLAELLFPGVSLTPDDIEARYPQRQLPEGAKVTRFAPSPTGFMHLGNLFGALTDERLAHQSGGVFFLRIEDTDQKREVPGGVEKIITVLERFGLRFDEGASISGESGGYGPYRQRSRAEIYHVFAKKLVSEGMAYPCFCTEQELADMRAKQEEQKVNFGYYGEWAIYRDRPIKDIESRLSAGEPWVLRFRSPGDPEKYIHLNDLVKGKIDMPENDQDIVLLKSDGIPTYHFAHVVDDHLMRTTHVVRGEEWIATWPVHVQLFAALGWKPPKYCHTAQLMKMDGESKRKLSKRKDPELSLDFYDAQGFPGVSVIEYLLTLLNSNFEEWRLANPMAPVGDFKFSTNKMGVSGALFDLQKLDDVSKNVISRLSADVVYDSVTKWAALYDEELYALLTRDEKYAKAIFAIGRGGPKPRKDFAKWSDVRGYLDFFYDEIYRPEYELPANVSREDADAILERYADIYDSADDQTVWFGKIKELAARLGFAPETKLYKKAPEQYKGHVGDVSMVLRVAVTGRQNSPDMHQVMAILGRERTLERLAAARAAI